MRTRSPISAFPQAVNPTPEYCWYIKHYVLPNLFRPTRWYDSKTQNQATALKKRHYEILIPLSKQQIKKTQKQTKNPTNKKPCNIHSCFLPFHVFSRSPFFNYKLQTLCFKKCHKHYSFSRTVSPVNAFSASCRISHPLTETAARAAQHVGADTLLLMSINCTLHCTVLLGSAEN